MTETAWQRWLKVARIGVEPFNLESAFDVTALSVLLLAIAVRIPDLITPPWADEQVTLRFVRAMNYFRLLTELPVLQPHFPTYYLLAKGFHDLTGLPVLDARVLSLLAGVATVPVAYRLCARHVGRWSAMLGAALIAVSPPMLAISGWLRMYALLGLAAALAWLAADRALDGEGRWGTAALAAIATGWLHPFGLVCVGALASWVGLESYLDRERPHWRRAARAGGLTAVALAPVVLLLLGKFVDPAAVGSSSQLAHLSGPPSLTEVVLTPAALLGGSLYYAAQHVAADVFFGALALGCWRYRHLRPVRLAAVWVGVALAGTALLSWTVQPIFQLKYLLWASPAVAVGVAGIVDEAPWWAGVVLVGLLMVITLPNLSNHGTYHTQVAHFVSRRFSEVNWI